MFPAPVNDYVYGSQQTRPSREGFAWRSRFEPLTPCFAMLKEVDAKSREPKQISTSDMARLLNDKTSPEYLSLHSTYCDEPLIFLVKKYDGPKLKKLRLLLRFGVKANVMRKTREFSYLSVFETIKSPLVLYLSYDDIYAAEILLAHGASFRDQYFEDGKQYVDEDDGSYYSVLYCLMEEWSEQTRRSDPYFIVRWIFERSEAIKQPLNPSEKHGRTSSNPIYGNVSLLQMACENSWPTTAFYLRSLGADEEAECYDRRARQLRSCPIIERMSTLHWRTTTFDVASRYLEILTSKLEYSELLKVCCNRIESRFDGNDGSLRRIDNHNDDEFLEAILDLKYLKFTKASETRFNVSIDALVYRRMVERGEAYPLDYSLPPNNDSSSGVTATPRFPLLQLPRRETWYFDIEHWKNFEHAYDEEEASKHLSAAEMIRNREAMKLKGCAYDFRTKSFVEWCSSPFLLEAASLKPWSKINMASSAVPTSSSSSSPSSEGEPPKLLITPTVPREGESVLMIICDYEQSASQILNHHLLRKSLSEWQLNPNAYCIHTYKSSMFNFSSKLKVITPLMRIMEAGMLGQAQLLFNHGADVGLEFDTVQSAFLYDDSKIYKIQPMSLLQYVYYFADWPIDPFIIVKWIVDRFDEQRLPRSRLGLQRKAIDEYDVEKMIALKEEEGRKSKELQKEGDPSLVAIDGTSSSAVITSPSGDTFGKIFLLRCFRNGWYLTAALLIHLGVQFCDGDEEELKKTDVVLHVLQEMVHNIRDPNTSSVYAAIVGMDKQPRTWTMEGKYQHLSKASLYKEFAFRSNSAQCFGSFDIGNLVTLFPESKSYLQDDKEEKESALSLVD